MNIGEILVKELRSPHVCWNMYQNVQVNGKDGRSLEEGKTYISEKFLIRKDERPDYLFSRLHQADCVSWLKALIVQGSPSYMSLSFWILITTPSCLP